MAVLATATRLELVDRGNVGPTVNGSPASARAMHISPKRAGIRAASYDIDRLAMANATANGHASSHSTLELSLNGDLAGSRQHRAHDEQDDEMLDGQRGDGAFSSIVLDFDNGRAGPTPPETAERAS